jgi:inorganic pyrophosphatase
MKFVDGGEIDDKIIGVLASDKRCDHITSLDQLGDYFKKEMKYFWENYKAMKKPGTGVVGEFVDAAPAIAIVKDCADRYEKDYKPQVV